MEEYAPLLFAFEHDNVGLILGSRDKTVKKIMIALDLTDSVVDEAVENSVEMIVTHHPPIFKPISRITTDDALGRRLIKLLRNDVTVYSAHTNLDIAHGGTSDVLAGMLGLENLVPLDNRHVPAEGCALGRVGDLPEECTLGELAQRLKSLLGLGAIAVTGDSGRAVRRVGLCTGSASGPDYISMAKSAECDVYVTGDVTYHNAQFAADFDIGLIDATHHGTEVIIVKTIKEMLESRAAENGAELTVIEPQADTRVMHSF